jgi:hypothetical protein
LVLERDHVMGQSERGREAPVAALSTCSSRTTLLRPSASSWLATVSGRPLAMAADLRRFRYRPKVLTTMQSGAVWS